MNKISEKSPYIWDYNISPEQFDAILKGSTEFGKLNRDWAVLRLLEYSAYQEIISKLGFKALINGWTKWRDNMRSVSRKRGFDFLVKWVPLHHPEWIHD